MSINYAEKNSKSVFKHTVILIFADFNVKGYRMLNSLSKMKKIANVHRVNCPPNAQC